MIIAFANQKGGVGKTCLAFQLYGILSKQHEVSVQDLDPQKSLTNIMRRRGGELSDYVGANYMIIDLPPGDALVCRKVMTEATYIIVPILPCLTDIESSLPLYQMYQKAIKLNPDLHIRWIINAARYGSNILEVAMQKLKQLRLPHFSFAIPHSVYVAESMSLAIPMIDYRPYHAATESYQRLLEEIRKKS